MVNKIKNYINGNSRWILTTFVSIFLAVLTATYAVGFRMAEMRKDVDKHSSDIGDIKGDVKEIKGWVYDLWKTDHKK